MQSFDQGMSLIENIVQKYIVNFHIEYIYFVVFLFGGLILVLIQIYQWRLICENGN